MCAMGREVVKEKKGFQWRVGSNLERWGAHGQGGQGGVHGDWSWCSGSPTRSIGIETTAEDVLRTVSGELLVERRVDG